MIVVLFLSLLLSNLLEVSLGQSKDEKHDLFEFIFEHVSTITFFVNNLLSKDQDSSEVLLLSVTLSFHR